MTGREVVLRRLFEPLGTSSQLPIPLDERFPNGSTSEYLDVSSLTGTVRLKDLLEHLFVLVPVLDDDKHYWVGVGTRSTSSFERGGSLARAHPDRRTDHAALLAARPPADREALARLMEEDTGDPDEMAATHDSEEEAVERPLRLGELRLAAVVDAIRRSGARRVLDLGCGSAKLVEALLERRAWSGWSESTCPIAPFEAGARQIHLDDMTPRQRARVDLLHGSLTYRDSRLAGFDAAAVVEVVEHLDPSRLGSFERVLFGHRDRRPSCSTTPNADYNVRFESFPAASFRNRDHRFEWSRAEFRSWPQGRWRTRL